MAFTCNINRVQHFSYQPLKYFFDIASLSERRKISDMKFLVKPVKGFINRPEILNVLNFNVPQCRTRFATMLYIFTYRTKYALASLINRIMSIVREKKLIYLTLIPFNHLIIM